MVARLLTCVQFSGSARQYYKVRVTSDQNHRGSEPLLNNGTGVIFGMINFFSWPSIISRPIFYIDCQNQMYMYPGSVTIKSTCISRGCRIGSRISLKWVQILQRMARFGYFYLRFHRNACKNNFSLMGVK